MTKLSKSSLKKNSKVIVVILILVLIFCYCITIYIIKSRHINVAQTCTSINELRLKEKSAFGVGVVDAKSSIQKEQSLVKILLNAEMEGYNYKDGIRYIHNLDSFYEIDFSKGQFWVEKVASKLNPTLFYMKLYDVNNTCYVVLCYATDSKRNYYQAIYSYKFIKSEQIKKLIKQE